MARAAAGPSPLPAAGQSAPETDPETGLALAEAAALAGDLHDARRLLQEAYGPDVLALPDARPPTITQALLHVDSGPTGRQIGVRFVDGNQGVSAATLAAQTVEALRNVAPVAAAGSSLTITLAYTDPTAIVAVQGRLAAALPRLPELALLNAALTPRRLAWPEEASLVARTSRYEERVDLTRSAATWNAEADKLEAAASKLEDATGEAEGAAERLDSLRAMVWRGDARAWRDLAALSRVTYRVELQERGAGPEWLQARVHQFYREGSIQREWVVRAGEVRQLEAAVLGWRYDRVALAAGAAILLAALTVGLIWWLAR